MGVLKKSWSLKKQGSGKEYTRRWTWRPWRLFSPSTAATAAAKWKRVDIQKGIMDNVVFKVMYVVEALVLVSTLCFFYLCCGCHF